MAKRGPSGPDKKSFAIAPGELTKPWMVPFLLCLRQTGVVSRACEKAGIGRWLVYENMHDKAFADRFAEAMEDAVDMAEDALWRRAIGRGRNVIPSDGLLKFLLQAYRPQRFRQDTVVGTVIVIRPAEGVEHRISSVDDLKTLSNAELEMLAGEITIEQGDYRLLEVREDDESSTED